MRRTTIMIRIIGIILIIFSICGIVYAADFNSNNFNINNYNEQILNPIGTRTNDMIYEHKSGDTTVETLLESVNRMDVEYADRRAVGMEQLVSWLDIFCTGHKFKLSAAAWSYIFPKTGTKTISEIAILNGTGTGTGTEAEGDDSEDGSAGGGTTGEKYHKKPVEIADNHVFTEPHISAVVPGTPWELYKITKRVAIKNAYAEQMTEIPEDKAFPETLVIPGDETTYSNATFFAKSNDLFKSVLTETGRVDKTTNVFIYATSLGKDSGTKGGPKTTGSAYQEGEKQDAIWITTGQQPNDTRIKRGAKLNQAGRALDYFETLVGGTLEAGHELLKDKDADHPKIHPTVAVQYGGNLVTNNPEYISVRRI